MKKRQLTIRHLRVANWLKGNANFFPANKEGLLGGVILATTSRLLYDTVCLVKQAAHPNIPLDTVGNRCLIDPKSKSVPIILITTIVATSGSGVHCWPMVILMWITIKMERLVFSKYHQLKI